MPNGHFFKRTPKVGPLYEHEVLLPRVPILRRGFCISKSTSVYNAIFNSESHLREVIFIARLVTLAITRYLKDNNDTSPFRFVSKDQLLVITLLTWDLLGEYFTSSLGPLKLFG